MPILLSILIPYTPDRSEVLWYLIEEIKRQIGEKWDGKVEVLIELDDYILSVGKKRQMLLERASGEYCVYVDSDDEISHHYIDSILTAIEENRPDVISYRGWMTHDGKNREDFIIMKDLPYETKMETRRRKVHYRHSNHLTPTKREIALQIGYKDMKKFEDFDYSVRLKESGLLKTECYLDLYLYHYKLNSTKKTNY